MLAETLRSVRARGLFALLSIVMTAQAETVRVDYTGIISVGTDTGGLLAAAGIQSGSTPLVGSFVYDTTQPPYSSLPTFEQYPWSSSRIDIGTGFSASGENGDVTIGNERDLGLGGVMDAFEHHQSATVVLGGTSGFTNSTFFLLDRTTRNSFASTVLPTAQTLAGFQVDQIFFRIDGNAQGQRIWDMFGTNLSWSVTSIPEPNTLWLFGAGGLLMLGLARSRNRSARGTQESSLKY